MQNNKFRERPLLIPMGTNFVFHSHYNNFPLNIYTDKVMDCVVIYAHTKNNDVIMAGHFTALELANKRDAERIMNKQMDRFYRCIRNRIKTDLALKKETKSTEEINDMTREELRNSTINTITKYEPSHTSSANYTFKVPYQTNALNGMEKYLTSNNIELINPISNYSHQYDSNSEKDLPLEVNIDVNTGSFTVNVDKKYRSDVEAGRPLSPSTMTTLKDSIKYLSSNAHEKVAALYFNGGEKTFIRPEINPLNLNPLEYGYPSHVISPEQKDPNKQTHVVKTVEPIGKHGKFDSKSFATK
jgi:hypothetical protein